MKEKGLVIWVGSFVAVVCLYAAYKSTNHKVITPWAVIGNGLGGGGSADTAAPPVAAPNAQLSPSDYITSGVGSGFPQDVPAAYASHPKTYIPGSVTNV